MVTACHTLEPPDNGSVLETVSQALLPAAGADSGVDSCDRPWYLLPAPEKPQEAGGGCFLEGSQAELGRRKGEGKMGKKEE